MNPFRFETILLAVLVQREGNGIRTLEQLPALKGAHFSSEDLALSGDIAGLSRDLSVAGFWKALFGPYSEATCITQCNFTSSEESAVFRDVRRIVLSEFPRLAEGEALVKEVVASALSISFLVWLYKQTNLSDPPNLDSRPTLLEYIHQLLLNQ